MTRMTGPDCAVMCNLVNTHTLQTRETVVRTQRHGLDADKVVGPGKDFVAIWIPVGLGSGLSP